MLLNNTIYIFESNHFSSFKYQIYLNIDGRFPCERALDQIGLQMQMVVRGHHIAGESLEFAGFRHYRGGKYVLQLRGLLCRRWDKGLYMGRGG